MNEWLSAHGIGKRVPTVSGGTVLLGSSRGGERKQEREGDVMRMHGVTNTPPVLGANAPSSSRQGIHVVCVLLISEATC
jgi:hypothetical protein